MKKKIKVIALGVSVFGFIIFASLYSYAWIRRPNPLVPSSMLHLTKSLGIFVTKDWGGQVAIYNKDGPYLGSMLGNAKIVGGWDGLGTYYRRITVFQDPKEDWRTFMFSIWYALAIFGIPPLWWWGLVRYRRMAGRVRPSK
jgi:hypothetical protein